MEKCRRSKEFHDKLAHSFGFFSTVPDEAAERVPSRQDSPLSLDPLNSNHRVFHNRSTHEPRHSNSKTQPSSASLSGSSAGSEGKELGSKKSSEKKSWLSWSWSKTSNKSHSSKRSNSDEKRSSVPQWRLSGADMANQRRAVNKCNFEDDLSIEDLEWVSSPGSSAVASNGSRNLSWSASDVNSWTSRASDIQKKTGKVGCQFN